MPRRRLFVAVWPPGHVVAALEKLDRPDRPGLRWTTPEQWHVTLRFLGSLEDEKEDALRVRLSGTDWGALGPREVTVGPGLVTIGRTVLGIPVSGLDDLAAAAEAAAATDAPPGRAQRRAFMGHLTLARAKTPAALRGLSGHPFHASWPASAVTLVNSDLRRDGARYEVVQTWGLRSPGD